MDHRDRESGWPRVRDEAGFSLVELLVVAIIIGLLAAVAIPRFLNQQDKARNADALSGARLALVAMESYGVANGGYDGADRGDLLDIEPTLSDAPGFDVVSANGDTFELHTISESSDPVTFTAQRLGPGEIVRLCNKPGRPSCSNDGW